MKHLPKDQDIKEGLGEAIDEAILGAFDQNVLDFAFMYEGDLDEANAIKMKIRQDSKVALRRFSNV